MRAVLPSKNLELIFFLTGCQDAREEKSTIAAARALLSLIISYPNTTI